MLQFLTIIKWFQTPKKWWVLSLKYASNASRHLQYILELILDSYTTDFVDKGCRQDHIYIFLWWSFPTHKNDFEHQNNDESTE